MSESQEPHVHLTTRDGRAVTVRHIQGDDAKLLEQMFYKLSPQTRWRRFFVPLEHIDAAQVQEAALVALVGEEAGLAAVAVARYAGMDERGLTVESSIVVRDDYQHSGLGAQLLDLLFQTALARGVQHVVLLTHADNTGMIALAKRLGLPYEGKYSAGLYEIDVQLGSDGDDLEHGTTEAE
jgi:L-amino acid N-acyltransferase YncA